MTDHSSSPDTIQEFIQRWASLEAAERANYQIFLTELCGVLSVPRLEPTRQDESEKAYVFEKAVTFHHADGTTSSGRIDLYKRGCFVLEAKQVELWDEDKLFRILGGDWTFSVLADS